MQSFRKKLIIFILPLLAAVLFMETGLNKVQNSYNKKRSLLEGQEDSIQVLVLGSSHAVYGIDPAYFSCHGFNLANINQDIYYDVNLASNYLNRLHNLKSIVVSIDYNSLWRNGFGEEESWRNYFYYHFWDVEGRGIDKFDSRTFSLTMLYGPATSFHYALHSFKDDLAEMNRYGWLVGHDFNDTSAINDSSGRARVRLHNSTADTASFRKNISMLTGLLHECLRRGVQVTFITTPVYRTYYRYIDSAMMRRNIESISKLCFEYHCTYYNYFTDNRFTISDFADNDHLQSRGTRKFSKILDADFIHTISR